MFGEKRLSQKMFMPNTLLNLNLEETSIGVFDEEFSHIIIFNAKSTNQTYLES